VVVVPTHKPYPTDPQRLGFFSHRTPKSTKRFPSADPSRYCYDGATRPGAGWEPGNDVDPEKFGVHLGMWEEGQAARIRSLKRGSGPNGRARQAEGSSGARTRRAQEDGLTYIGQFLLAGRGTDLSGWGSTSRKADSTSCGAAEDLDPHPAGGARARGKRRVGLNGEFADEECRVLHKPRHRLRLAPGLHISSGTEIDTESPAHRNPV